MTQLHIAGRDCTADLGADITADAVRLSDPAFESLLRGESSILALGKDRGGGAYTGHFVELVRGRASVETADLTVIPGRGPVGRVMAGIRRVVWRVTRFAHEWIAFRQNTVNSALAHGLEFEQVDRKQADRDLEARLARLEQRLAEHEKGGHT